MGLPNVATRRITSLAATRLHVENKLGEIRRRHFTKWQQTVVACLAFVGVASIAYAATSLLLA